jgi:hypothetical protein
MDDCPAKPTAVVTGADKAVGGLAYVSPHNTPICHALPLARVNSAILDLRQL